MRPNFNSLANTTSRICDFNLRISELSKIKIEPFKDPNVYKIRNRNSYNNSRLSNKSRFSDKED